MDRMEFLSRYIMENDDDIYALSIEAMPESFQDEFLHAHDECARLYSEIERALQLTGMERVLEMLKKYVEMSTERETLVCNAMFVHGAEVMYRD